MQERPPRKGLTLYSQTLAAGPEGSRATDGCVCSAKATRLSTWPPSPMKDEIAKYGAAWMVRSSTTQSDELNMCSVIPVPDATLIAGSRGRNSAGAL